MSSFEKLLNQHVEKYLQELPIKDHIKDWKVLYHGSLELPKGDIYTSKWDVKLYLHYEDTESKSIRVIVGVKVK